MAYCTATEAKDKDLSRQVAQAAWVDADVDDRIAEGDAVINGYLGGLGYDLPFAVTPPLVKRLSILYARYACLRDMHHHFSPSQAGGKGYEGYKEQFDALIKAILAGEIDLIDAAGEPIPTTGAEEMRVQTNTVDLQRAMTMGDPESEILDGTDYADAERLGNPE
jgi:phage gp36-like protein